MEYLRLIHEKHEKWFEEYDESRVLVLDTSSDFKDKEERIEDMVQKVN